MRYAVEMMIRGKWVEVARADSQSYAFFLSGIQEKKWGALGTVETRIVDTDCGEYASAAGDDEMSQGN